MDAYRYYASLLCLLASTDELVSEKVLMHNRQHLLSESISHTVVLEAYLKFSRLSGFRRSTQRLS
jgi:hypothetical protein